MKTKRFLAIMLCILLLGNLFPVAAYASGDTADPAGSVDVVSEEELSDSQQETGESGNTDFGGEEDPGEDPDLIAGEKEAGDTDASGDQPTVTDDSAQEQEQGSESSVPEEPQEDSTNDGVDVPPDTGVDIPSETVDQPEEQESEPSEQGALSEDDSENSVDTSPETEVISDTDATSETDDSSETNVISETEYPAFAQSRTVGGVEVTVQADAGVFPADAVLLVEQVPDVQEEQADEAINDLRDGSVRVAVSYTFDIKVVDPVTGVEYQPADGQTVSVSFCTAEVADRNLDTQVYHIADNGSAEELEVSTSGETAVAETDGFSLYTVEFTYNTLEYVLQGDSSVFMADILEAVGLTGEVTEVETSDPGLFFAAKLNDKWIVTAKQAFSTTEWMKVTIGGVEYEIIVTDTPGEVVEVDFTDTLTVYDTDAYSTAYVDWTAQKGEDHDGIQSDAVYAGSSAKGNGGIQMRSKNNHSGIVTTASGGIASRLKIVWVDTYGNGNRFLNIYGSNTAYISAADLYNDNTDGTYLGELSFEDTEIAYDEESDRYIYVSELVIEDGYRYIGVRSKTGALYLESVQIGWDSDQIKPVWSWADDFRAATATFTDAAGDAAVLNAEVTQEITKEATYIAEGECTYTALVIYNGTTYTDRKTAMIPKLVFTGPVTYVDENGDLQDAPGTTKILTGTEKSLGSGWYAVVCDISYKDYIGLDGDVKLILCDGTSLEQMYGCFTITETPNTSLTIYGQENNSGRIFQKPGLHRRRFRNFRK